MKFFTNKKIWSKIIIVLIFVILFEFVISKPTLAENDVLEFGGKLLSPILSLVVTLGDGVIGIVHDAIMGVNNSLIEVNMGSTIWEIIGKAFVWILAAAIAIAIVATGIGGIIAAVTVGLAVGIYGTSIVENATADKVSTAITSYNEKTIPDTLYLPAYTISPEEIFQGKILLFNINFFEQGKNPIAKEKDRTDDDGNVVTDAQGNPIKDIEYYYYEDDENEEDLDGDGKPDIKEVKTSKQNMAVELRELVSTWYVALRNIALVAMLSMLVYVGIRILLSSVASDKAKYKQMLQDWLIRNGVTIFYALHYGIFHCYCRKDNIGCKFKYG